MQLHLLLKFVLFSYIIHPFLIYFFKANRLNFLINLFTPLFYHVSFQKMLDFCANFGPSLPCENVLYYNRAKAYKMVAAPSLPCENVLYCDFKQWHYRLLNNFNLATNGKGVVLVHLYFRHSCQGP